MERLVRALGAFSLSYALVVVHQTLFWALVTAMRLASTNDSLWMLVGTAMLSVWFLLGALMTWPLPIALGCLSAALLGSQERLGFALHVVACIVVGAATAAALPWLFELVRESGPNRAFLDEHAALFWFLGIEGGVVIALVSWRVLRR